MPSAVGETIPALYAELDVDVLQVVVDRAGREEQPSSDVAARQPVGGEQRDLPLPLAQRLDAVAACERRRDDPFPHRASEGGDSSARRDRAPLIALRGEAVGEISGGLRREHERARRHEALDRGLELLLVVSRDANGVSEPRCARAAVHGFGEGAQPFDRARCSAEPHDVVTQRGLEPVLAEACRVVGRLLEPLPRRGEPVAFGGEPCVGTIDVGVEDAAVLVLE